MSFVIGATDVKKHTNGCNLEHNQHDFSRLYTVTILSVTVICPVGKAVLSYVVNVKHKRILTALK